MDRPSDMMLPSISNGLGSGLINTQTSDEQSTYLSSIVNQAKGQLIDFARSEAALADLLVVFDHANPVILESLRSAWEVGDFSTFPQISVLKDANMNGAQGGFAIANQRIYLAESLVSQDPSQWNDPIAGVVGVVIEELGHYIDSLLHSNGGDTAGDEGEAFKTLVLEMELNQPELIRIQSEDDRGTIIVNGEAIAVEQAKIRGNNANNIIKGTETNDKIWGRGGNDRLSGNAGKDRLLGGDGDDQLDGGIDRDRLFGNSGEDILDGNTGNDKLAGGDDADVLLGRAGRDRLNGGSGADKLDGGIENDRLFGGDDNDILIGGEGRDRLDGQDGDDRLNGYGHAEKERDRLKGGTGSDTFVLGNNKEAYYIQSGRKDFALIEDLDVVDDRIVLPKLNDTHTSDTEAFGYILVMKNRNTEIRTEGGDRVAVLKGITDISLTDAVFGFQIDIEEDSDSEDTTPEPFTKDLGVLSDISDYADYVEKHSLDGSHPNSATHTYTMRLDATRRVHFALRDLTTDATVRILDDQGQLIKVSEANSTDVGYFFVNSMEKDALYTIEVAVIGNAQTDYKLVINPDDEVTPVEISPLPPIIPVTSEAEPEPFTKDLGVLTDIADYGDYAEMNSLDGSHPNSATHTYTMRLDAARKVHFALRDLTADATVRLLDNQGQVIKVSEANRLDDGYFSIKSMEKDTPYTVEVAVIGNGQTDYNLVINPDDESTPVEVTPLPPVIPTIPVAGEGVFGDRLYQTVRGTDDIIYTRWSTNGVNWEPWLESGGKTLSPPDLEVFKDTLYQSVRGIDNHIYFRSSTDGDTWTTWQQYGGETTLSSPDMEVFNGKLYQSFHGVDNEIYIRSSEDGVTWSEAKAFGGSTFSAPALEAFNGLLYQSVRGTNGRLYTRSSVDGETWGNWDDEDLTGYAASAPDMEVFNGKLYQSVRGIDNHVYTRSSSDGKIWSYWKETGDGGTTIDTPVMSTFNNLLYQTVVGTDRIVYTRSSADGETWTHWAGDETWMSAGELDFNGESRRSDPPTVEGVNISDALPLGWRIVATGDFDKDGQGADDIVLRHEDGTVSIWMMNGHQRQSDHVLANDSPDNAWQLQATGDFNNDGKTDILWRHQTGVLHTWFMDGVTKVGHDNLTQSLPDEAWTIVGTGNFDNMHGSSTDDLLLRHTDGRVEAWVMNGTEFVYSRVIESIEPSTKLEATGDFDGDGKTDLLWRHQDGRLATWLMDGMTRVGGGYIEAAHADNTWQVQATGDFNSDGTTDILWQHSSRQVDGWLLNGTKLQVSFTGLPMSAANATEFFKLQYTHSTWNPTGPRQSNNCGPASLAMLMETLGVAPRGVSIETSIDHARYLMNPDAKSSAIHEGVRVLDQDGKFTTLTQLEQGIRNAGGSPITIESWESLNQNLTSGNPMVVLGYYGTDWKNVFPDSTLAGSGSVDHFIAILGRTGTGKYIVADPMYKGGPVEMTQNQLAVFFKPNSNSVNLMTGNPRGRAFDLL